jgi:aminomethyltransferase
MPIPSPFHPRTSTLCTSLRWKDWAGYFAVCAYDTYHEREYYAFRHAAGLMDVTPLFKYEVTGPDAAAFLAQVMVRNIEKLKVGRVTYCCWCDDEGKVLDDGTVSRLDDDAFRVTAAEPNLAWFHRNARGFDVCIEDSTERVAAVSLQGPRSREVLAHAAQMDLSGLRFFALTRGRIAGGEVVITRTGYTGDLGYEVWTEPEHALAMWDAIMESGAPHGIAPAGLDALDVCRMEAGFVMNGVDYYSANHCLIESRKSTPDEIGLGWTVNLDRGPFNGQAALQAERAQGSARRLVGLEVVWDDYEALFAEHGLPPDVCSHAWRDPVPVYTGGGTQVGQATSGSWSPTLKRNLALATVDMPHGEMGDVLRLEVTVEYERRSVRARVADRPFFDPPRKRE